MAEEKIEQLVEGGKATAAPPLGPALGPLGVNVGEVVEKINEKTASFKGMQVPVTIKADPETKEFDVEVGTPPASSLIKKEAQIEKGSGSPKAEKVADLKIEQIIKIAKMKEDDLMGKDLKKKVKEVIGACTSIGVLVEGMEPKEAIKQVNEGKYDNEISQEKTEISQEEQKELEKERKQLEQEAEKRHAEQEETAKKMIAEMKGKSAAEMRKKLLDEGIPEEIFKDHLPKE